MSELPWLVASLRYLVQAAETAARRALHLYRKCPYFLVAPIDDSRLRLTAAAAIMPDYIEPALLSEGTSPDEVSRLMHVGWDGPAASAQCQLQLLARWM